MSLFWEFFKIGLFTIGGGMAMLPLIQKLVVEDKKWLSEEETIDCLAVSQARILIALAQQLLTVVQSDGSSLGRSFKG